jgi:hypothetical protein
MQILVKYFGLMKNISIHHMVNIFGLQREKKSDALRGVHRKLPHIYLRMSEVWATKI